MANDKVTIWNGGLKLGRPPAANELLVGNGEGFDLATLTAGSGVTISNTAGAVTINATGSGGTVTSVTASSPLASSGGATPDISLGTVGADKGGTGQSSLTLNNAILGNGIGAVQFVAPGTSGNLLTSNGTTWQSVAPASSWNLLKKTTNYSITSTVANSDVPELTFFMAANKVYAVDMLLTLNASAGGYQIAINGPTIGAGKIRVQAGAMAGNTNSVFAYETLVASSSSALVGMLRISATITNGENSGTFAVRFRQNSSNVNASIVEAGSYLEYAEIA